MSKRRGSSVRDPAQKPLWRYVRLLPLVQDQMRAIMVGEGVTDPDAMLADIVQRDAEEYAQRPQDLIELCALWRTHQRIGTHLEQVQSNVEFKLQPRRGLGERVKLSPLRAEEGASRLALAALLCRTLTFRFSADSDRGGSTEAAIDPIAVLTDWSEEERQILLERPLFGFATYGR